MRIYNSPEMNWYSNDHLKKRIVASENVFYGFDIYSMRNATNSEEHTRTHARIHTHTRTEILTRSFFFPNYNVSYFDE